MKIPIFYLNPTRFHSTLLLHSSAAPSPTRHHDIPSRVGFSSRTNPFRCLSHIAQKPNDEAFLKKSPPRQQKMIFKTRLYGSSQTSSNNNNNTDDDVEASKKEEKKKREVKLGLVKRVYGVLAIEFLLAGVAYTIYKMWPQAVAIVSHNFYLFFFIILTAVSFLIPIKKLEQSILLGFFNVVVINQIGVNLADLNGKVVLAAIKNPGSIPVAVNTWVGTVTFLGYIVCDTQKLLKHGGCGDEEDDELVETSLDLHVDISSIFFRALKIIQIFFKLS
ncbi:hypothetical protein EZV62_000431 [Acer yangbiense]|uniref:Transmembrane protein n=1 Tax=Acer yangbiense TaxID=1000413 RepID=A0A5C7ITV6_9ROSI|nr:hypothetical protein EZV62_000431 [Acer yangbiense]